MLANMSHNPCAARFQRSPLTTSLHRARSYPWGADVVCPSYWSQLLAPATQRRITHILQIWQKSLHRNMRQCLHRNMSRESRELAVCGRCGITRPESERIVWQTADRDIRFPYAAACRQCNCCVASNSYQQRRVLA